MTLHLGTLNVLLIPIAKQLAEQGLRAVDKSSLTAWQADAQAINQLSIRKFIAPKAAAKMRVKLGSNIAAGVVAIKRRK